MKRFMVAAVGVILGVAVAMPVALADSISSVEGARAKERAGQYLSEEDADRLRRYNGNDDGYYSGGYGYSGRYGYRGGYDPYYDGYASGGGVSVYIGPSYGPGGYGYY